MRRIFIITSAIALICVLALSAFAHPGRTDSAGGHSDNINGGYHYHHGYSAHQHPNGECPYEYNDHEDDTTTFTLDDFDFEYESFSFVEPEYPSVDIQASQNYSTRHPSFLDGISSEMSSFIVVVLSVVCGAFLYTRIKKI